VLIAQTDTSIDATIFLMFIFISSFKQFITHIVSYYIAISQILLYIYKKPMSFERFRNKNCKNSHMSLTTERQYGNIIRS